MWRKNKEILTERIKSSGEGVGEYVYIKIPPVGEGGGWGCICMAMQQLSSWRGPPWAGWPDWANFRLLGEFSPIGRLFTCGQCLENLGYLFSRYQLCINYGLGYILGDFFKSSSGHPGRERNTLSLIRELKLLSLSGLLPSKWNRSTKERVSTRLNRVFVFSFF
jgi:hypothetical protein